ncbi:hypothetical protein HN51_071790 [Arachis hypogaea]|uniref:trihelix transcription factor GT-2 n=1 Tax=Arachis ipaensis TaxID=130454 RepID=UPI0007AFDBCE|nr:trihelix transcription factor GT-2 [Arachis ipaensis]XP_025657036.2 trihelix transcription factor GT-2 [Arachis hypogaea]QHO14418.1 Trihelix transcription factor [Arachis hypogaea]
MQLEDSSILSLINNKPVMAVTAVAAPDEDGVKGGGGEVVVGMEEEEEEVVNATNSSEENNSNNKGREEEEGGGGGRDDGGDKMSFGGNRWPRQETLALLKIRSDMDSVFRDSTLKGPLWEEVSRKLGEIGYKRSAKKCKEKFENVYKYHKRTKEGRTGKSEGKTYKFFDQLQALENHNQFNNTHPPPKSSQPLLPTNPTLVNSSALPSTTVTAAVTTNNISSTTFAPHSFPNNNSMNLFSSPSSSPSSSTASDEGLEERYKKKRKWKDYFRKLTRQVLAKQEEMQNRFLEAIDRRERERVAQEEAWRLQEMSRIANEHDVLVQERSTAAAKDAAVIALLHKLSGHETQSPQTQTQIQKQQTIKAKNSSSREIVERMSCSSSSRWPKGEVHALIRLRTSLDSKYMENGPKAPLWEDISGGMQRLGYNRSAKRCKEKWENINKYFKKVKESNKQRREDSKTCPYFHELEALYKDKISNNTSFGSFQNNMEPLMVQPEQQWRPPPESNKDNNNESNEEEEEEEYDDDGVEEEEEDSVGEEEEGLNRYQIVTNKVSSVDTVE